LNGKFAPGAVQILIRRPITYRVLVAQVVSNAPTDLVDIVGTVGKERSSSRDFGKLLQRLPALTRKYSSAQNVFVTPQSDGVQNDAGFPDVFEYFAGGMTEDQILTDFCDLTRDDIRVALTFAGARERRVTNLVA
jgi:hypothetical protein